MAGKQVTGEVRHRRAVVRSDGQLLQVGDRLPLPKSKLELRPARSADDPTRSPRGVFRNGRGKA